MWTNNETNTVIYAYANSRVYTCRDLLDIF